MAHYGATLDKLREILKNGKAAEATKDRELKDVKASNKELEGAIGAIEQIVADYQGKVLGFQKNQDRHECYQEDTLERVKAKLGDTKPVDDLVAAYDKAIADLKEKIKDVLEPAVTAAKNSLDAALVNEQTKKDAFEALKKKVKTLEALFKAMDELGKSIDGLEKEAKLGEAYFLLTDHAAEIDKLTEEEILDPSQFETDLIEAQEALAAAAEDVRTKKNLYEDAVKARDDAEKDLEKLDADRRKTLLDQIAELSA